MMHLVFKRESGDLEKSINYHFKNTTLLEEALTHPSVKQIDTSKPDYERLELLGDSILGFLIAEMVFHKFSKYQEGKLSKIKAYAVSCETIVKIATSIKLADYMILTQGEEDSGGRSNRNNIENTMEALIGAIYLDSDIETIQKIVTSLWEGHIENVDFAAADPKTYLQELVQSKMHITPSYEVIDKDGIDHAPIFTVRVSSGKYHEIASGKSIKEAEKEAARKLLSFFKS